MTVLSPKRAIKIICGSLLPLALVLIICHHQEVATEDETYRMLRNGGHVRVKPQSNVNGSDPKHHPAPSREKEKIKLDFIVAGFPKCGTTTLLHSFLKHNETAIAPDEFCDMDRTNIDPKIRMERLNKVLAKMPDSSEHPVRRGIKCPMAIWDGGGIQLISSSFKHTRIIAGLRHPVLMFESFYNYRITEMYDIMDVQKPPSPLELIGKKWRDVSTDLTRYELSLMQLGKTPLSSTDLIDLGSHGSRLTPTRYKLFLYSIEQLNDSNEERARNFRLDLERFLRLKSPLEPFPNENSNRVKHDDTIDICDPLFNDLRKLLTKQGKNTARWIRDELLKSEDIFVGGRNHFIRLLDSWQHDPCLKSVHSTNFNGRPIKNDKSH